MGWLVAIVQKLTFFPKIAQNSQSLFSLLSSLQRAYSDFEMVNDIHPTIKAKILILKIL